MSIDLSPTIVPKSDQMNADDLMGGRTRTIRITKVSAGDKEQPITINFEGDNRKPYKPGKSMRRVLVYFWGKDGAEYVGKSLTLYTDEDVVFGGQKVGGLRISHMSDIEKETTVPLTVTRGQKRGHTVRPLREEQQQDRRPARQQTQQQQRTVQQQGPSLEDRLREVAREGSPALREAREKLVRPEHIARAEAIAVELDNLANDADARDDGEDQIDPSQVGGSVDNLEDLPF